MGLSGIPWDYLGTIAEWDYPWDYRSGIIAEWDYPWDYLQYLLGVGIPILQFD